jgi:hypothetical protein
MYDKIREKCPIQFEPHEALKNLQVYISNLENNASSIQPPPV